MSAFSSIFDRLLRRPKDLRALVLGLDASGKTTILYRLKLGEIVTTIPTIGFNVETITVKNWNFTLWDVGGCGTNFRPLIRHYYQNTNVLIYVIDVTDEDRMEESLDELYYQLQGLLKENGELDFVAIMLNKLDKAEANPACLYKVREAVTRKMSAFSSYNVQWGMYKVIALAREKGEEDGLWDAMNDVADKVDALRQTKGADGKRKLQLKLEEEAKKAKEAAEKVPTLDELRQRADEGVVRDVMVSPEELLAQMRSGRLKLWDHRMHLRIAYTILTRHLAEWNGSGSGHGALFDAVDEFLEHLAAMLRVAEPGKFRNTVHRTMTMFWMYEILRGMANTPHFTPTLETAKVDTFRNFLWNNPQLMYGGAWKEYYSPTLLFSPSAKDTWQLPDLKPLPPLLTHLEKAKAAKGISSQDLTDARYAERVKRFSYAVLQRIKITGERRGKVIKEMIPELKREIIRARVEDSSQAPYSETQFYFWMQIVHAVILSIEKSVPGFDIAKMNYNTVLLLFPDTLGDNDLWKKFYKEDLWNSVDARMWFRSPSNGKVVPNVWPMQAAKSIKNWRVMFEVDYPSQEELANRARWMVGFTEKVKGIQQKVDSAPLSPPPPPTPPPPPAYGKKDEEDDDDDDWVDVKDDIVKKTAAISIQEPIVKSEPEQKDVKEQDPASVAPETNDWVIHARLIHDIFNRLVANSKSRSELTRAAYSEFKTSDRSMTANMFYTKLVLSAYVKLYPPPDNEEKPSSEKSETEKRPVPDFNELLEKNPELAWENLWRVYYSEAVWRSENAKEKWVSGDLRDLPAHL